MAIIQIQSKKSKEQNFTKLIEENKLRFYKTAKVILKNDDDVYDALQEALISIYQNYDKLENIEYFSTWATRIVINKCYDLLRKNKNNVIPIDESIENDVKVAQYDEYEIDKYGIKKAMECLNENLKLITILYYYDNYSIKEISQIVDIPEGTVKSRLSKSREILKQELGKEEI
jgi:RNA polymerase sigma-70 factor (ECF subfamily)